MAAPAELIVLPDAAALAAEVAERTLAVLAATQRAHGRAAIALTAGSIMTAVWREIAASSSAPPLDWSKVDVFWGDERFVPIGTADRNDLLANEILFDHQPFAAVRQFAMPASDGLYGTDLDAAAAGYAAQLRRARRADDPPGQPAFDVVLLGVGPDGHCCSLFPDHPGVFDDSAPVIAVRNSPKPPPNRLSLSFDGLTAAREIWVVASGDGKADAVAQALSGADRAKVPSAGAVGTERTLWLVDREAAAKVPTG